MKRHKKNDAYICMFAIWILLIIALSAFAQQEQNLDADIAFIGLHGGVYDSLKNYEKALNIRLDYLTDEMIARGKRDLSVYKVVLIQHSRAEQRKTYCQLFKSAKTRNPQIHIISISGMDMDFFKDIENIIKYDPDLQKYYGSSNENLRRLLIYVLAKYMNRSINILPPEKAPEKGIYHPDHDGLFDTVQQFLDWSKSKGWDIENSHRVVVAIHATHLMFQQPYVADALVKELNKQHILAAVMINLVEPYEAMVFEYKPDVVIHTCHSQADVPDREKLGAMHLQSLYFRKQSIDEWYASAEGVETDSVAYAHQLLTQELLGTIEPHAVAGTLMGGGSDEAFTPIPDQVESLVARVASWINLRHKKNNEKRIAIIYYDRELGKAELMRGSATGMFMNAPRSLINVLKAMKDSDYSISQVPKDEDELLSWMIERGRQIGVWAPGELDKLVKNGDPILIPTNTYTKWFEEKVPESLRNAVIKRWGPSPGRFLVWKNSKGKEFIVIPRVELGNTILLPQPLRGEAHETSLLHDVRVPPPHNYLATYFWLQEGFKADALIHFGTHGSEFLLPGKGIGLSSNDWSNIIMGNMPNISLWIINNMGELMPNRRRGYAQIVDHLTPPLVNAGLSDELQNIQNEISKWNTLMDGALKTKFQTTISQHVKDAKLDNDLHFDLSDGRLLTSEEIEKTAEYLDGIYHQTTPISLHIFGEAPREDLLIPYLVSCLRKKFLDELGRVVPVPEDQDKYKYLREKAEIVINRVIKDGVSPSQAVIMIGGKIPEDGLPEKLGNGFKLAIDLNSRFARTHEEIDNLLNVLSGKFVLPGPGNEPIRNPASVPTGRNMYTINPEEIPSQASWEIGKTLVDQLLQKKLKETKQYPKKIGFTLSSFDSFTDYGVIESQIMYLIGVEPVWNDQNLVTDIKLIPKDELKRPRIDVFIAMGSYYRDNLPSRMQLLDKAFQLVAQIKEDGNTIYENSVKAKEQFKLKGISEDRADMLSKARMFGYPAGQYGSPEYYYLVERSGFWDTREDLMDIYLSHVKNVYTQGRWGESAPEAYDEMIKDTEIVVRGWSRDTTTPLSNKYTWYIGGSLALAVKHLTGREPEFYLSDVRDNDNTTMVSAEDALRREYRVSLFNRKWIEGMMKEGYAGADQVAVMVSNTMGWKIMRENSVSDDIWEEISAIFVDDKLGLSIRKWFDKENPYAFQEMTEVMLESIRKGYWNASDELKQKIAEAYASSVAEYGEGGGILSGGNTKLEHFVEEQLNKMPSDDIKALIAQYQNAQAEIKVQFQNKKMTTIPVSITPQPQNIKTSSIKSPSNIQNDKIAESKQTKESKQVNGVQLERKTEEPNGKQKSDSSFFYSVIEKSLPFLIIVILMLLGYLYDRQIIQMQRRSKWSG